MKYLLLYDSRLKKSDVMLSDWAKARASFTFKSCDFKKAPTYKQPDGDIAIDPVWLEEKGTGYDGIVAYVKGDMLKGMRGTHIKRKPSIVQTEHHPKTYLEYKDGIFKETKKKTKYPQPQYTLDHELKHSFNWLWGRADTLHAEILAGRYDTYHDTFPLNNNTMEIIQKPTPNQTAGRGGQRPEILVVHVMEGTLLGTDSWFASAASQVSAHYGIGKGGEVHQYVKEADTAWANGRVENPSFKLHKPGVNPNSYSISIEHEGTGTSVWSKEMKQASVNLIKEIAGRWNIPIDRDHVIAHYQIYSAKPNCPDKAHKIVDELVALAAEKPPISYTDEELLDELRRRLSTHP